MEEAVINTRDVIIAILQGLGMVLIFLGLVFAPAIYDALKAKPATKTGNATPFGINKTNQKQK